MEDTQIIHLFYKRSEQAIAALEKKYGRLCCKIANNMLNSSQDVEECVNDAYYAVWNSIPPQNPAPLSAYICRIVRNLSVKKYHSNKAKKRNSTYDLVLEELEAYIPARNTIESEWESKELAKVIDGFLETLGKENRILFVKRYWFSESVADIAKELGMSEHTVSGRLYRIRIKMKKYLQKEGVWLGEKNLYQRQYHKLIPNILRRQ